MGIVTMPSDDHDTKDGLKDFDDDNVDEMDLILCNAFCCCNKTLYLDFPACCGCSGKEECLCCAVSMCCKPATNWICCEAPPDHCCQLGLGCFGCGCKEMGHMTCCLAQSHLCCIVTNAAFPTTDEVPLSCAIC